MSMIKNMITGSDKKKNLPPNRFLQFFYIIKENFLLLFYSSITYFVFILPLIYILLSSYLRFVSQLNTENIDSNSLLNTIIACGVLLIPCIIISSIGATGIHSVIIKLIYDEGCLYKDIWCDYNLQLTTLPTSTFMCNFQNCGVYRQKSHITRPSI